MKNSKHPERSYWEGSWTHPTTGESVYVGLPGTADGPLSESRDFVLQFASVERLDRVVKSALPAVAEMYHSWTQQPLHEDYSRDLRFAGIGVDDPRSHPVHWELMFEFRDASLALLTVPMIDDTPQRAYIDD